VFTMWCTLIALYISRWLFLPIGFFTPHVACLARDGRRLGSMCSRMLASCTLRSPLLSHNRWHSTLPLLSHCCFRALSVIYSPAVHAHVCTLPLVLLPWTRVQSISLRTTPLRMRCQRTTSQSCAVMWCRTMTLPCWQHSAPLQEHR
jgi:hypothetical protein